MINMLDFNLKSIKRGSIQIVRLYQTIAFNMCLITYFDTIAHS